jgi:hypothetical protein
MDLLIALAITAIITTIGVVTFMRQSEATMDTVMRQQSAAFQSGIDLWLAKQRTIASASRQFRVVNGTTTQPSDPVAFLASVSPYLRGSEEGGGADLSADSSGHFTSKTMRDNSAYMTVTWDTNPSVPLTVNLYIPSTP